MNSFKVGIANKTIEINTIYVLPYAICRRYFVEEKPDFCIQDTQEEIEQLQAEFEEEFDLTVVFPTEKHRHSGEAETASPVNGNHESGHVETASKILFYRLAKF